MNSGLLLGIIIAVVVIIIVCVVYSMASDWEKFNKDHNDFYLDYHRKQFIANALVYAKPEQVKTILELANKDRKDAND